jgi:hypothetical protein
MKEQRRAGADVAAAQDKCNRPREVVIAGRLVDELGGAGSEKVIAIGRRHHGRCLLNQIELLVSQGQHALHQTSISAITASAPRPIATGTCLSA